MNDHHQPEIDEARPGQMVAPAVEHGGRCEYHYKGMILEFSTWMTAGEIKAHYRGVKGAGERLAKLLPRRL